MERRAREARETIMNREQIKFTGTWSALTSVILDGYLQQPVSRYFRISLPSSGQILVNPPCQCRDFTYRGLVITVITSYDAFFQNCCTLSESALSHTRNCMNLSPNWRDLLFIVENRLISLMQQMWKRELYLSLYFTILRNEIK